MRAAVQVAVGNRRPCVCVLPSDRAVVHGDVTIHSHVRLFTRGAVVLIGSRQGRMRIGTKSLGSVPFVIDSCGSGSRPELSRL
jgi:hypothetical protein